MEQLDYSIFILFGCGNGEWFWGNMPRQITLEKVAVNNLSPPLTSAPTNEKHHMLQKLIALTSGDEALRPQEATAISNPELGAVFSSVFQASSSHAPLGTCCFV